MKICTWPCGFGVNLQKWGDKIRKKAYRWAHFVQIITQLLLKISIYCLKKDQRWFQNKTDVSKYKFLINIFPNTENKDGSPNYCLLPPLIFAILPQRSKGSHLKNYTQINAADNDNGNCGATGISNSDSSKSNNDGVWSFFFDHWLIHSDLFLLFRFLKLSFLFLF